MYRFSIFFLKISSKYYLKSYSISISIIKTKFRHLFKIPFHQHRILNFPLFYSNSIDFILLIRLIMIDYHVIFVNGSVLQFPPITKVKLQTALSGTCMDTSTGYNENQTVWRAFGVQLKGHLCH